MIKYIKEKKICKYNNINALIINIKLSFYQRTENIFCSMLPSSRLIILERMKHD